MKLAVVLLLVCFGFIRSDDCVDKSPVQSCQAWASRGFCTNCFYTCEERISYCQKTCNFCEGQTKCENCTVTTTTPGPSTTTIKCEDYGDFCADWKKKGFCADYPCEDARKYCPKTCGLCAPGACPN